MRGADEEPGEDDFLNGVKLLIKKYKPQVQKFLGTRHNKRNLQVILGTTGTLKRMISIVEPAARRVICDESGTIATIDVIHMLTAWKNIHSMMLVGDTRQLANFSAPLDKALRKYGFDSVLMRAAAHPNVGKTTLTEVRLGSEARTTLGSGLPLTPGHRGSTLALRLLRHAAENGDHACTAR